jgi:hypothetical protein
MNLLFELENNDTGEKIEISSFDIERIINSKFESVSLKNNQGCFTVVDEFDFDEDSFDPEADPKLFSLFITSKANKVKLARITLAETESQTYEVNASWFKTIAEKLLFVEGFANKFPQINGLWRKLSKEKYWIWNQLALLNTTFPDKNIRSIKKSISWDLSEIISIEEFFFSLGETVNGPLGYYGACLTGFDDCVLGDFGNVPPFELIVPKLKSIEAKMGKEFIDEFRKTCEKHHIKLNEKC